jgi:peptide/nickel transport system permease protein
MSSALWCVLNGRAAAPPGIGQLFVSSVKVRDIPVVQACCLIFAGAYILLNLAADVLAILSNPRLRHPR